MSPQIQRKLASLKDAGFGWSREVWDWGETSPMAEAEALAEKANVSVEAARFTVAFLRIGLALPLTGLRDMGQLEGLLARRPPREFRVSSSRPLADVCTHLVRDLMDGHVDPRAPLHIADIARRWDRSGLPADLIV